MVDLRNCRLVDLSHPVNDKVPTFTGACGFKSEIKKDYCDGFRVMKYSMHAGFATHMDAPSHFAEGGRDVGQIPLDELVLPCAVLHLSKKCHEDYWISPQDILEYENVHGRVEKNSLFFVHSGWDKYWGDNVAFRNEKDDGKMHFPGFSLESCELLMERGVSGIGIDVLSPDGSNNDTFPIHHLVLGEGKYILESVAHLNKMPPKGAYVLSMPLKIEGGAESPVRCVGVVGE